MGFKQKNIAYYLKYRPQALSQLIGQDAVKKTLLASFSNNKLSHAYLFVGPRGTGKTSTARILAKMVNCSAEQDIPCNKCDSCISITDGSNLDLIEIDAASNRGIDDIRSLRDKIKLSPGSLRKKVYIIDEVHMLTTEAFNALLKTLEEPPSHVLFIMATTDASKIPQTIISRVQRLDFKLADVDQLLEAFKGIVKEEKVEVDEEALMFLAKKAEGSFRDGVKLLDQVASIGEKITVDVLESSLKSTKFDQIVQMLKNLAAGDNKAGLLFITKYVTEGGDIKDLILSLMDSLRSLVLIKSDLGEQLIEPHLAAEKYGQLMKLSDIFSEDKLISCLDFLQKALEKMKVTTIAQLPLEIAVVEICKQPQEKPVVPTSLDEKITQSNTPASTLGEQAHENHENIDTPSLELQDTENTDIRKLKEKWTFVLETIRPYNFSLEALLRSINITDCTSTTLTIEVPYSFHQRILEAPKNRDLLESIFSDILGRSIRVSAILGNRPIRREDIANIEVAADDEIIRAAAEIFNSETVN